MEDINVLELLKGMRNDQQVRELQASVDWALSEHPQARLVGLTSRGTAWVDYGGTDESWRALADTFQRQEME